MYLIAHLAMGVLVFRAPNPAPPFRLQEDRPAVLLARSIRGTYDVNVVATLLQNDHRGIGLTDRIRMFRSKSGKQHGTVIEPLSRSGWESLDDGRRLQIYYPDERQLLDLDSPSLDTRDIEKRIEWAKANYQLETEPHSDIAGRPVVGVVATPRAAGLDIRRYYFDNETGYPLRLETVSPSRKVTVVNDTKDIHYPKSLPASVFELHPLPGVTRVTYRRPRALSSKQAKKVVGFVPLVPRKLPFGFKVQELQYSDDSAWKPVFVRLTDGLVRANLYQWLPDGMAKKARADSTFGQFRGVDFLMVSDSLSPEVRQELLKSIFAGAESWEPRN